MAIRVHYATRRFRTMDRTSSVDPLGAGTARVQEIDVPLIERTHGRPEGRARWDTNDSDWRTGLDGNERVSGLSSGSPEDSRGRAAARTPPGRCLRSGAGPGSGAGWLLVPAWRGPRNSPPPLSTPWPRGDDPGPRRVTRPDR